MKPNLLLFLLVVLITHLSYSQNFVVYDAKEKQPLPFATVIYGEDKGAYADKNGKVELSTDADTIEVSMLGFKSKKIAVNQIQDSLFLEESQETLAEVKINETATKTKKIKAKRKRKSAYLIKQRQVFTFLQPTEKLTDAYLNNVTFYFNNAFRGVKDKDGLENGLKAVIRFNLFELDGGELGSKIYEFPAELEMTEKDEMFIDLSNLAILIPKDGLAFGLELVGLIDADGKFSENKFMARPKVSKKENKFYTAKSYRRLMFKEEPTMEKMGVPISVDEFDYNYNLAFDLEVDIQKK
ncbi:MAG: carboxypeptidase-like regulatory domain-containing protein [Bacteroidota bacterium]